jgi:hypothetical protein
MARVAAAASQARRRLPASIIRKLKLLGLDVASWAPSTYPENKVVEVHDTVAGIYRKC